MILALLALVVALGGCAFGSPNAQDLKVPSRIGAWTLTFRTEPDESEEPVLTAFFEAAGGISANSVWAKIFASGHFAQGFRVVGATPDAMWAGADESVTPGSAVRTTVPDPFWELARFDEPGRDGSTPTWIAVRGDRLFLFGSWTREDVATFLDASK